MEISLYTRQNCCLCDEAKVLLFKHLVDREVSMIEIDVDDDPELAERFGNSVPVVAIDGVVRFRGKVNEVLLIRLLKHG